MKILLTGGAGFIGSHCAERLLARGDEVVCVDNFNDSYDPAIKRRNIKEAGTHSGYALEEGDIRDYDFLCDVARRHRPEKIIHLAARAGVRPSLRHPRLYEEVNCAGTLNILELAREYEIPHFVFGSSSSVYGINSKVPFSEDDRLERAISPYAVTKRSGELMCHAYHHLYGIPVTCLRFFTVYGPRQRPEMAIHNFTRKITDGEEIQMFAEGLSSRDYTYIDDIVDGIMSALDRVFPFEIINLGDSRTVKLRHLVSLLQEIIGTRAKINSMPSQPGDVPFTCADIRKATRLLDYRPNVPIEEGLRRFVEWYTTRS